jgi:hypothetical protein
MSGYEQEQKDIESRFAASFSSLPVKYRNTNYKPQSNQSFCEFIIANIDSVRASIGVDSPLHRNHGVIIANIHVPKGSGTIQARQYADQAAAIFRDAKFSGVTCRSPEVKEVGDVLGWFVVSMMCPFFRDKIL